MATISITIQESSDQIISGIPKTISLSTNVPATIFFTLDGTDPDTMSDIYTTAIILPTNSLKVIFKVFATNGPDSSAIITNTYVSNITGDRLPHAAVTDLNNSSTNNSLFPYGTNSPNPTFQYRNNAESGTTVNNPALPLISSGFDADGNPALFTNKPLSSYELTYSTTDSLGKVFPGVGTLPSHTEVIGKNSPIEYTPESSDKSSNVFNPKALVIFQDSTTEKPEDPVHINRQFFALENQEIVRDGNLLYNSALDSPTTHGSFLRSHYNPRTNMLTSYYYDGTVNRWIISSYPYETKNPTPGNLSNMVFSRPPNSASGERTNGFVFQWHPFRYRTLI